MLFIKLEGFYMLQIEFLCSHLLFLSFFLKKAKYPFKIKKNQMMIEFG